MSTTEQKVGPLLGAHRKLMNRLSGSNSLTGIGLIAVIFVAGALLLAF